MISARTKAALAAAKAQALAQEADRPRVRFPDILFGANWLCFH